MGKKEYYFAKLAKDDFKLIKVSNYSKESVDDHI